MAKGKVGTVGQDAPEFCETATRRKCQDHILSSEMTEKMMNQNSLNSTGSG